MDDDGKTNNIDKMIMTTTDIMSIETAVIGVHNLLITSPPVIDSFVMHLIVIISWLTAKKHQQNIR